MAWREYAEAPDGCRRAGSVAGKVSPERYSSARSPYWIDGISTITVEGRRTRTRSRRSPLVWPWTSAVAAAIAEPLPPREPSTRSSSAVSAGVIRACAGTVAKPATSASIARKRRKVRSIEREDKPFSGPRPVAIGWTRVGALLWRGGDDRRRFPPRRAAPRAACDRR